MNERNHRLRELARTLRPRSPAFVLMGSAALSLWYPELDERYTLPDLDVLVRRADDALALAAVLDGAGFAVTCWGEPLARAASVADLQGKLYVRATRDDLQVDVSFESVTLDIPRVMAAAVVLGGLPVGPLEDVWLSKLRADLGRTMIFARETGLEVPAAAIARERKDDSIPDESIESSGSGNGSRPRGVR